MNYILRGIVAASLMWPTVAGARDIDFQNFEQSAAHTPTFVLGEPKASSSAPLASTQANDRLADAFGALGDADSPPLYFPRASLQQSACFAARYQPSPGLSPAAERRRAVWFPSMAEAACRSGVPVPLLDALIIQESRYNPSALSPKGASGISQLMPGRARILGVRDVWNPVENMRGSARYLRSLLDEFGRFDLALAAYNAGEGRVRVRHQVPRIRETIGYVSRILLTMRNGMAR